MYWIVDLKERIGQRVVEDAQTPPYDGRFLKVEADSIEQAIARAEEMPIPVAGLARTGSVEEFRVWEGFTPTGRFIETGNDEIVISVQEHSGEQYLALHVGTTEMSFCSSSISECPEGSRSTLRSALRNLRIKWNEIDIFPYGTWKLLGEVDINVNRRPGGINDGTNGNYSSSPSIQRVQGDCSSPRQTKRSIQTRVPRSRHLCFD